MNASHTNDPLSLRYELAEAFASYADAPSPATAFAVAAALGQTRLFGVELDPESDGRLTPELAAAAAAGLEAALPRWIDAVRRLDAGYADEWRTEGDEDCIRLLEDRTRAWGALVAVREAADARPELCPLADRAAAVGRTFDRWLRSQEEELSAVADLPLLSHWKALLVPPHRDPLPWWLSGTLAEAAARVQQAALAAMPSAAVWRVVAGGAILPPVELTPTAAAQGAGTEPVFGERELWWRSPDGRLAASLTLPAVSTAAEEAKPRPINFEPADAVPPGTPVRLGTVTDQQVDAEGQFRVTLAQLRNADLRLEVGGQRWHLTDVSNPAEGSK